MEQKIKCHLCKGEAELKFETLELDNGRIILKDSPYYKCNNCKEEFSTSEQMKELDEQINTKFVFKRQLITAGRSIALTIPSDLAQHYGLKKGRNIEIIPQNKKQIILNIK